MLRIYGVVCVCFFFCVVLKEYDKEDDKEDDDTIIT